MQDPEERLVYREGTSMKRNKISSKYPKELLIDKRN